MIGMKTVRCKIMGTYVISLILLMFSLTAFFQAAPMQVLAAEEGQGYVDDGADLFSSEEEKELEGLSQALAAEMEADVLIVTTADNQGKGAGEYSERYYIDGNFGVGENYNGIIFLIDMDGRELYINSVGDLRRYFTDDRRENMLDAVYGYAADEDFTGAAECFLTEAEKYYKKGIPAGQYNYDEETGKRDVYRSIRWFEAVAAVIAAAAAAGFTCLGVVNSYSMKGKRKEAEGYRLSYRAGCQYEMNLVQDHFLRKHTTHTVIRTNTGSSGGSSGSGRSTSHSRSGRSFSGSGRKF